MPRPITRIPLAGDPTKLKRDPVRGYIRRAGIRYLYEWTVDGGPLESPRDYYIETAHRAWELLLSLSVDGTPERAEELAGHLLGYRLPDNLFAEPSPTNTASPEPSYERVQVIRELLLKTLAHIQGIRDDLLDSERETWVLIQHTHDPRLDPRLYQAVPGTASNPGSARKAHRDKRARAARMGKTLKLTGGHRLFKPHFADADWPKSMKNKKAHTQHRQRERARIAAAHEAILKKHLQPKSE